VFIPDNVDSCRDMCDILGDIVLSQESGCELPCSQSKESMLCE
jgi:hypothetical protein